MSKYSLQVAVGCQITHQSKAESSGAVSIRKAQGTPLLDMAPPLGPSASLLPLHIHVPSEPPPLHAVFELLTFWHM